MTALSSLDALATELGRLVRQIKQLHAGTVRASGAGLELPSFFALARLREHDGLRPSGLADELQLDLSTVSRQLAALERAGYVVRERDPHDSRAQLVRVTDAGLAVLDRMREARLGLLADRLQGWSASDLELLASLLHRFTDDLAGAPLASPRGTA